MHEHILNSPVGNLKLIAHDEALVRLIFIEEKVKVDKHRHFPSILEEADRQLKEYFEGERSEFDIELDPAGTEFQLHVWKMLKEIPYGITTTYSELSKKMGNPKAVRAIGRANGQNPIPIIIPCHRVVGANNDLVGYAGGIEIKRRLLQHEGSLLL